VNRQGAKRFVHVRLALCAVVLVAAGGCRRVNLRELVVRDEVAPPASGVNFTSARFQVIVYEVTVSGEGGLDVGALTEVTGSPMKFERGLGEHGAAAVLYQIDRDVRVGVDERIRVGLRQPIVTVTRDEQTGRERQAVTYRAVGAMFDIRIDPRGKADPYTPGRADVKLTVDLSAPVGQPARDVRTAKLTHDGSIELARPFILTLDAKPVTYVARVVISNAGR